MNRLTKEELLAAMQCGERLYADDHLLLLGEDPSQLVPAAPVRELINEGKIVEHALAADYSEFELTAGAMKLTKLQKEILAKVQATHEWRAGLDTPRRQLHAAFALCEKGVLRVKWYSQTGSVVFALAEENSP